jgi:hypothetical protein
MQRALLGVCLSAAYVASPLAPISLANAGATALVSCRGSERVCSASVSIAGGASNRLVMIELPGTSWRSPSVSVSPASSRGAYSISSARFTLGGSAYRFILNAVRGNPQNARLTLTFRAPGSARPNTAKVACRGSERVCSASVSIAGGASNRLVMIELPGTSWRSPSVSVSPASSRGAYSITSGRFTLGGSEYRLILNAVRANPRGSHLTLTFRKR